MDFEPWWLILVPVLFGLGWVAARVDIRQMLSEHRRLPDSYFKGLNFLLNEQPDRAIDAFIEVAKLDPETVELHFALGSLFRRRGELERAIRVHQNLLQRADLPEAQREQAQFELAQDYLKAGLLDRAETAFQALTSTGYAAQALRALLRLYETAHDWPRAIATLTALRGFAGEPVTQAAHYYCEQAEMALSAQPPELDAATAALDAAAGSPGRSLAAQVRTSLLQARLASLEGDTLAERAILNQVLEQAPLYGGLAAQPLFDSYRAAGDAVTGLARLEAAYARAPDLALFDVLFQARQVVEGASAAWAEGRQVLAQRPALQVLDRLLALQLQAPEAVTHDTPWLDQDDARRVRQLLAPQSQRLSRHVCSACGFQARRFYWQCPGCNAWDTYSPKRLEELELS